METYLNLLKDVLENGVEKSDRTGVGTISVFGRQFRHNLQSGFPLLTTKKLHWKSIAHELFWMLNGSTNNNDLTKYGVTIWNEWAKKDGSLGPVYGKQWREWIAPPKYMNKNDINLDKYPSWLPTSHSHAYAFPSPIDQIELAIKTIKTNPDSRRNIVTAWNPADISEMMLPPCHMLFQFYVANGKLSCHLNQRSADIFLGVPYNIASYALLTHLVAYVTYLNVGDLIISFGDLHIYKNHVEQVKLQLSREPYPLPTLHLSFDKEKFANLKNLDSIYDEGFCKLTNYVSHPAIKAEVAV